jgi:hypothetical protein
LDHHIGVSAGNGMTCIQPMIIETASDADGGEPTPGDDNEAEQPAMPWP